MTANRLAARRQAVAAPETPLAWLAWKRLAAELVRRDDLKGALGAYQQADSRAPESERAEIASRIGWLQKEQGNQRAASSAFRRSRTGLAPTPYVTYAILAITVGLGFSALIDRGAQALWFDLFDWTKTRRRGRALPPGQVVLVHGGTIHLLEHVCAALGADRRGCTARRDSCFSCPAAGSMASYVLTPNDAAGASGAIFGLFGILFVAGSTPAG
jgi:hypothetical protein